MDYPELIAELTDRTGDSGLAMRAKLYLDLAEVEINKLLRVAESEEQETITTDANGQVRLPDDFNELRLLTANGFEGQQIELNLAISPIYWQLPPNCRWGYAVKGDTLYTTWPDMDMVLHYYAKVPSLALTGSNWLIESDPEIYIYGVMKQAFMAKLDAAKADVADQVFRQRIEAKANADYMARFGKKHAIVAGNVI